MRDYLKSLTARFLLFFPPSGATTMPIINIPRCQKFLHTFQHFIPRTEDQVNMIKKPSAGAQTRMSEITHLLSILRVSLRIHRGIA